MAGVATVGSGGERSNEGVSSEQSHQSGVALTEWRSCEQVENGTPSTSPLYWDSDDVDEGPKPSELYWKHTWKIDKFSKVSKRELKSDTFEVGGYKWYILIYPQGCDVSNHLSLFLCVADHDKLLLGWEKFAQFTIAVVNKDPKKSKYSDTLHRFWRKEHDWGWKKFIELSKVLEGFIDTDTLIIKAQVQVIRVRRNRPFRCLDCQYRRELVRVYLTNVEQNCRRFAEERQGKIKKLIDDKTRWSSFRAFWLCKDQNSRNCMSRDKTESILKVLVKHFFIEKEVTSTLVMDSLYSGLKALEGQHKGKISTDKYLETEELPSAIVRMENGAFVLVDDVLTLLERAAIEPLPPKDEKAPQNRTKDGSLGEDFNKDSIERDERRLTELGRRNIEIFTLDHIFSKIEVSYQEAVSLQRQEELIREEEMDKEKKSKKKQCKQKRNNRKGKDKGRDNKLNSISHVVMEQEIHTVERKEFMDANLETTLEKFDAVEDTVSNASDSVVCVPEIFPPDLDDKDAGPAKSDTDISEVDPPTEAGSSGIDGLLSLENGSEGRVSSMVDDSSSTCSSDSVPFVAVNGPHKGNSRYQKNRSHGRFTDPRSKLTSDPAEWVNEEPTQPSKDVMDVGRTIDVPGSPKAVQSISQVADRVVNGVEKCVEKEEGTGSLLRSTIAKDEYLEVSRERASCAVSLPRSPSKNTPTIIHPVKSELKGNSANDLPTAKKLSLERYNDKQADKSSPLTNSAENSFATLKSTKQTLAQQATITAKNSSAPVVMSRPLSAPLIPISMPAVSTVPTVQAASILPRSASSAGRLGPEPPQSYRNAIMGGHIPQNHPTRPNMSYLYSQAPVPNLSFGSVNCHEVLPNGPSLWIGPPQSDLLVDPASLINDMQGFDLYNSAHRVSQDRLLSGFPVGPSGRQGHLLQDEFPHLDIINDLLDDEHGIGNLSVSHAGYQGFGVGSHYLNQQVSFPGDPSGLGPATSSCRFDRARNYGDSEFQHGYGSPRIPYDARLDMAPQASLGPYVNGQVDGLVPPNQWQMGSLDMPFVSFGNTGCDPYLVPAYQNPSVGVNGYTVFRPSNGL